MWQLQNSIIWCTDCVGHLQEQYGVIFSIQMLASYIFSPRISVQSRNAAVDSAFVCPLYRGRVAFDYGVLYIVALCALAAFFQYCFYSISAHFAMYIVDLHLYQWPLILQYCRGALLVQCWFSAQCYSSSHISCSLTIACRRKVSQLVSLGVLPLQVALAFFICLSIQRISFSTRWLYTVNALCIAVASIYISSGGTAASRSSIIYSVLLQAPVILYRHQFYSFFKGARELFASSLLFRPIPQIWALYSIISLTTAVYSSCIYLKEGPQVKAVIYNTAIKAAAPLQVACVIYAFQFSLVSIQTPRTLRVVFSFTLQP